MPLDFGYAMCLGEPRGKSLASSEKSDSRAAPSQSKVVSREHLPALLSSQWLGNVASMTSFNSIGNIFPLIERERATRRR